MIIPKNKTLNQEQLDQIDDIVSEFHCSIQSVSGATQTVYAILGDERSELMIDRISGLNYISRVDTIQSPYKLMDIKSELAKHKIQIGKQTFGDRFIIIAGQCTIDPDNPQYFLETAHAVKEAGADALRGGIWKPRTNPYSYQGETKALDILLRAGQETGLPVNTEIMEIGHIEIVVKNKVDMIQIGTRNALNYSLLREIGKSSADKNMTVLLKRSMHMGTLNEFLCAGEYIVSGGNPNILLCPRGTVPALDGYRNHPDECITPLLKQKTWAPVVVDPSHSVGKAIYVPHAALAAAAYGADGLVIECHIKPVHGIGDDPKQAITPDVLAQIIEDAKEISMRKKRYVLDEDAKQNEFQRTHDVQQSNRVTS